eukprot:m.178857 g.178857  ORF g.178857 m.178857 type:complete len:184 (+) comp16598_c2_seq1:4641-5192(+)
MFLRAVRTSALSARLSAPLLAATRTMVVKAGDSLPDVKLYENTPDNGVSIQSLFKGKKGILFGVPGAFTPGCSKTHLPGYVEKFDQLKSKGVDVIACMAVNDPFVMEAWGQKHGANGKIRMLADTRADLTKALGVEMDATPALGNVRCRRFALIIEDNVIKAAQIEEGGGLSCSLAENIMEKL